MDRLSDESELRFAAYVGGLFGAIGHVDRTLPLRDYCLGLLLPGARKSVEPMAALNRARAGAGTASVVAALRRQRAVVR